MSVAAANAAAGASPVIGVVSARALEFRLGLDCPVMFARDLAHALFEPDPEIAGQLRACNPQPEHITVLPFALLDATGTATLRVTTDPACSSLRELDESFGAYFSAARRPSLAPGREAAVEAGSEVPQRSRITVERTVEVQTRTLDGLLAERALPEAFSPDVLSLDTAGCEYEALAGARRCVAGRVLSVSVAVDFIPRYRGERRFGDVHAILEETGFRLCALEPVETVSTRPLAVDARAREFPARTCCVYLRRVDSLERGDGDADSLHLSALKLAFLSVLHGQFSNAMDALEVAASSPASAGLRASLARLAYPAFLERFAEAMAHVSAGARPTTAPRKPETDAPATSGFASKLAGASRRLRRTWIVLMGGVPDFPGLRKSAAVAGGPAEATALEKLLRFHGFWALADEVQFRRMRPHAAMTHAGGAR